MSVEAGTQSVSGGIWYSSVSGMVPDTMCDFLKEDHKTKMSKMCEPLPPTSWNLSVPSARENMFFFFLISNLKEMKISCGLSWPAFCGSHRIPEAEVINKKFYSCGSEGFRCNQQAWPLGGDYAGCFTTWKRNCHVQKESTTWVSWLYNNSSRKNSPFYKTPWNQHRYNPKV